jgi:hypothetical protein
MTSAVGYRRASIYEVVGKRHVTWGITKGVLTIVGDKARVSIAWPKPAPKSEAGEWLPKVVDRFEDGTLLALWHWEEAMPVVDEAGA